MIERILRNSQIHGLPRIVTEPRKSGKLLWLILFITCLIGFCIHSSALLSKLISSHTTTQYLYQHIYFPIPTILLCPRKIFARDYIEKPPRSDRKFMETVAQQVNDADNKSKRLKFYNSQVNTYFLWNTVSQHDLYKAFFYRYDEMIMYYQCNGNKSRKNQFVMNFSHLACVEIHCENLDAMNPLTIKAYIHTQTSDNANSTNPIKAEYNNLPLFMQSNSMLPFRDIIDGIYIYLLDHNETSQYTSYKVSALPNMETEILIKAQQHLFINKWDNPCSELKKYYKFYNYLSNNIDDFVEFSDTTSCYVHKIQNFVYSHYLCVLGHYFIPGNLNLNVSLCLNLSNNNSDAYYLDILDRTAFNETFIVEISEECQKQFYCYKTYYTSSNNFYYWPNDNISSEFILEMINITDGDDYDKYPGYLEVINDLKRNESTINKWLQNFYKIIIKSGESKSVVLKETFSYNWGMFLSDMGGILGLYLGASVLVLCEVISIFIFFMDAKYLNKSKPINSINNDQN